MQRYWSNIGTESVGQGAGGAAGTAPLILTLTVNDTDATKVNLTFDIKLNTTLPSASAFVLDGNRTVSAVSIDATQLIVTLTVSQAYIYGEYLALGYTKPNTNPLKGVNNMQVDTFFKEGTNSVSMDSDYAAVYNAFTTKPSAGIATNQNAFVAFLRSNGIWGDIDTFRFLAQTVNTNNEALYDWKDATKIATLNGTTPPAFAANVGFTMLKTAGRFIDLLWKPSDGVNYTTNDCCLFFISTTNEQITGYDIGTYDGTNYDQIEARGVSGVSITLHGAAATIANTSSIAFFVYNRTSSTKVQVFKDGVQFGTDQTSNVSVGLSSRSLYLGARNNVGTSDQHTNRQYSLVGAGKALTATKVLNLNTAWNVYKNYGAYGTDLHAAFIQTDFSASTLSALRTTIISRIFPSGYPATGKDHITTGVSEVMASSSANTASIDKLTFHVTGIADREPIVWHPTVSNGKFVIFHMDHYYAATGTDVYELNGKAAVIRGLIDEGYTVCAIKMPPANDGTEGKTHTYPGASPYQVVADLHYFLECSARVLNEYAGSFTAYYMAGFSGGGWTTALMAALDERITKSAHIDGCLPITALDHVSASRDWEQYLPGLTDIVDYGDLYALGVTSGRKQTQYLGTYDLYFNYETYKHAPYLAKMKSISENFNLDWDSTTLTHEITSGQKTKIINFFNS